MQTLRLILGDQVNSQHSWFQETNEQVTYCMFEMRQETDYVRHHIQKIVGFFLAMRSFAEQLEKNGHKVIYYQLDHRKNTQSLTKNLKNLIGENSIQKFEYLLPDEYRLDEELRAFCEEIEIESEVFDTEHFYTSRNELQEFFKGKKTYLMENFYRAMRKKHDVLMNGDEPAGGKWNFDKSNQKKWKNQTLIPDPILFTKEVSHLKKLIDEAGIETIGQLPKDQFHFPVSRKEALEQLDYFCEKLLIHFGDYQDAMHTDKAMLYHSGLSFAMNLKLISAREVVERIEKYYLKHQDEIDISQVEGFIRQVIGWREYMRGVYWAQMPEYAQRNELENHEKLPDFYWTGKTKMNCLSNCIQNSLRNAYAHHIQRLMITGNFALLTFRHPDEVDDWYLGIYIDAIQWVQLPNTRGMSQWADGGLLATKPYVSSASYIHKMSNYCDSCHYDHKQRTGEKACPFNSLYWNFLDEKRKYFEKNPRMSMMLSLLDKISKDELKAIKARAADIIENTDDY
ncbi:cryptochrome/photolyase family protein [Jiulongibacter sediminis]|uniref:Deoxyribodipyrimidine photolyase n=1 Tax=Jiulongibacter sediminis TaxID=1605367 RepID=A0A0P7BRW5_9BACT|nr:cryptochrome/photolyase family protein [Jiulongibacter sediminis]KPM50107.1 deoxyribodipyrimidine photolyase [Jiulongibacter sediminis]TBX27126.1 deoxyribodipyrimidine photolyase [Jiulongibacter sediminis]